MFIPLREISRNGITITKPAKGKVQSIPGIWVRFKLLNVSSR
jgi:hypothetical protein